MSFYVSCVNKMLERCARLCASERVQADDSYDRPYLRWQST